MATTEMNCLASGGGNGGFYDTFNSVLSTWVDIDIGFAPKHILFYGSYSGTSIMTFDYDVENNKVYRGYGNDSHYDYSSIWLDPSSAYYCLKVSGNTFSYKAVESGLVQTYYIMAI